MDQDIALSMLSADAACRWSKEWRGRKGWREQSREGVAAHSDAVAALETEAALGDVTPTAQMEADGGIHTAAEPVLHHQRGGDM